jgi:hypothetical protein
MKYVSFLEMIYVAEKPYKFMALFSSHHKNKNELNKIVRIVSHPQVLWGAVLFAFNFVELLCCQHLPKVLHFQELHGVGVDEWLYISLRIDSWDLI